MPYSKKKLKDAQNKRTQLEKIIATRSLYEKTWSDQKEPVLIKTTVDFPDIYGLTLLDYAIILSDLPKIKELQDHGATLSSKALLLARKACDKEVLKYLGVEAITKHTLKKKKASDAMNISQHHLLKNLCYYQKLLNQDHLRFESQGYCSGFSFLKLYYSTLGKRDEFFKILQLLSQWNGSYGALSQPFDSSMVFSSGSKTLHELLHQLSNDLVWFQSNIEKNWGQLEREFLYSTTRSKKDPQHMSFKTDVLMYQEFSAECLAEYLDIFCKFPHASMELLFEKHATCLYSRQMGQFDYYDPNCKTILPPFQSALELAQHITKIHQKLSHETSAQTVPLRIQTYKHQCPQDYFFCFSRKELEGFTTEQMVLDFQKQSPNQFTPLHVAVLTGSIETVDILLKKPLAGGRDLKNAQNHTPQQMARLLGRHDIARRLAPRQSLPKPVLFKRPLAPEDETQNTNPPSLK